MRYLIAVFLIDLFLAFMVNYMEAFPFVIALFHVIYGRGRWGWFILGFILQVFLIIGAWGNYFDSSGQSLTLSFILEEAVRILMILFFLRLIKIELKKRDEAETDSVI